jgi:hypothetical protein
LLDNSFDEEDETDNSDDSLMTQTGVDDATQEATVFKS